MARGARSCFATAYRGCTPERRHTASRRSAQAYAAAAVARFSGGERETQRSGLGVVLERERDGRTRRHHALELQSLHAHELASESEPTPRELDRPFDLHDARDHRQAGKMAAEIIEIRRHREHDLRP